MATGDLGYKRLSPWYLLPAEVMSMIGMGVPLIGLYFLGSHSAYTFPRRGFQAEPGYDPS